MNDVKTQLLAASIDSITIAGFCGLLSGVNMFGQNYITAGVLLIVALFNVMQAQARFDLYKEQK